MMRRRCTAVSLLCIASHAFHIRPRIIQRTSWYRLSSSKRTILDPGDSTTDGGARDWQYVLHIAEDAARKAGDIMRQTTGRIAVERSKANVRDIVTDSDHACQQVIRQTVDAVFPSDAFLGEESVGSGSEASIKALQEALTSEEGSSEQEERLLWIVDPIDGTTNFQAGLPLFCASVGVVALNSTNEPEIMLGVIYNPILDEMVCAVKGRGAYLNGKRLLHNGTTTPLQESVINVGFPVVKESTLNASSKAVAALATKVRGLRMVACASQAVAWVARNQLQAYLSWDLNAWDVCAGMLILQESGGSTLDFNGEAATISSRDLIFTSDEALAHEILDILRDKDCLDYDKV